MMWCRRLLLTITCGLSASCADRTEAPPPAGIDSAIAAFRAESLAAATTGGTPLDAAITAVAGDTLIARVGYRCGKSMAVAATYWRGEHSRVELTAADTVMDLPQAISASGARYGDDPPAPEWWVKGDSARFTWQNQTFHCAVVADSTG
jgi:membrane-bound inhibitor of C-type lysozyme